jgi:hypothetical protein
LHRSYHLLHCTQIGTEKEAYEARLKTLEGTVTVSPPSFAILMSSAENNALRKAAAAQEDSAQTIPCPPRGVAGNGFNLQIAMGLEDDNALYATLRVSSYLIHVSRLLRIDSVVSGT